MNNSVRLLDHVPVDLNVLSLPVLFQGTLEACHAYCVMFAGYVWRQDESIFGGYYANEENGDCFLIA